MTTDGTGRRRPQSGDAAGGSAVGGPAVGGPAWGAVLPRGLRLHPAGADDRVFRRAVYAAAREDERRAAGWPEPLWEAFVDDQFTRRDADRAGRWAELELLIVEVPSRPRATAERRFERIGILTLAIEPRSAAAPSDDGDRFGDGGPVSRIVDVGLMPEARGRGFVTALIAALIAAARRSGLSALALDVRRDNRAAARLYARLGFRPRGEDVGGGHRALVLPLAGRDARPVTGRASRPVTGPITGPVTGGCRSSR